ncbi:hypothetical protein J2T57_002457 [Natronocella acetinitrilica]|uniref:Uncharacterized protein n=2 Tax=Natronocella acetinitrilica TaxID=414046 RepID=A0AAE3G470_9GAMM|nr:hypothetical protein [Natronocella acetinitrilica]
MEIQATGGMQLPTIEGGTAGQSAQAPGAGDVTKPSDADAARFRLVLSEVEQLEAPARPDVADRVFAALSDLETRRSSTVDRVTDFSPLAEMTERSGHSLQSLADWRPSQQHGPVERVQDFSEHALATYASMMESAIATRGELAANQLEAMAAITNSSITRNVAFKATDSVAKIIRGQ